MMILRKKNKSTLLLLLVVVPQASGFQLGLLRNLWTRLLCRLGIRSRCVQESPSCTVFPSNNIWNTPIETAPVHARSDAYVASIGSSGTLHPDFGSNPIYGIPYVQVASDEPDIDVTYTAYGDESDAGPYPLPLNAPIEGGSGSNGDRHAIALDMDNCVLYELYRAFPQATSWNADSGATYDLTSNDLRPDGWTSADAAGLPILPGLVRYNEVSEGVIQHALRFTAAQTQDAYVWPARHEASSNQDLDVPPMGQRFRLKAGYDISGFSDPVRVILTALKRYGMILADNGSNWFISGTSDDGFDDDILREIKSVPGSAFEAIDTSNMLVNQDSGEAKQIYG